MASRQEMKVDMEYRLAGIGIAVLHDAEAALVNAALPGNGGSSPENAANQRIIRGGQVKGIHDVLSRDEEEVMRRHGVDILDSDEIIVLIDFLRGDRAIDDFTEDATVHPSFLSRRFVSGSRDRTP